ncbi:MAG: DUF2202 domain-containing protein [Dinghuibacter sp.]|nr:DUF2202 domain-containing protein [Dinghuibacter sp.]
MNRILFLLLWALPLACTAQQTTVLQPEEQEALTYMREEEKLARDVYDSMYARWNNNPFGNIRHSERVHMEQVKTLLLKYKINDPVAATNDKPGLFSNSVLQQVYRELVTSGSQSFTAALQAGAKIEELDISDLQKRMALTRREDITSTFSYLVRASENHLRAFVRRLKSEGINYEPTILDRATYDAIIAREQHSGQGYGRNRN